MKYLLLALILTGCSGITEYSIKPVQLTNGDVVCCEATVHNSKDYEKLKFIFKKQTDGSMSVSLDESGVSSSGPNKVQADNNAKLLDAVTKILPGK